jgi:Arc/MetJ-type ribon-helix-helix transcriptional regulator
MSGPEFDDMSKAEIVEWFSNASDDELAEVVRTAQPASDVPAAASGAGTAAVPLLLTSIRLPVELVRELDEVAAAEGTNRSEAIRIAVAAFLRERRGAVGPTEAERALDVLRRLVQQHGVGYPDAA